MDIFKKQMGNPGLPGFTYTGDWMFQYNAPQWHIYFLTSGELKFTTPANIDLFLVGGGEAGTYFGAGGFGGEVLTKSGLVIPVGEYEIGIGRGGRPVYRNNNNLSVPSGYSSFSTEDADRAGGNTFFGTKDTASASAFKYTAYGAYSRIGYVEEDSGVFRIKRYGSNAGGYTRGTATSTTIVPESSVSKKTVYYNRHDHSSNSTLDNIYEVKSSCCNGELGSTYAFGDPKYPRFAPGGGGGQYGGSVYSSAQYPPCFRNEQIYTATTDRQQIGYGGNGICGADAGITYIRGSNPTHYRFGSADGAPNTGAGGAGGTGFGNSFPIGGAGGSGIVIMRSAR